jgi:hypothetical protein
LKYKKVVKIKIFTVDSIILNTLWSQSLIYGYTIIDKFHIIILKYTTQGFGIITPIIFLSGNVSKKEIQNLLILDSYSSYFVMTIKGIILCSLKKSKINNGGKLIAKL